MKFNSLFILTACSISLFSSLAFAKRIDFINKATEAIEIQYQEHRFTIEAHDQSAFETTTQSNVQLIWNSKDQTGTLESLEAYNEITFSNDAGVITATPKDNNIGILITSGIAASYAALTIVANLAWRFL